MARKKKSKFVDDGRTIADMNVEGMPWYTPEEKKKQPEEEAFNQKLTRKEMFAMLRGILGAAMLIAFLFLLVFFLFILFCSHVWLQ